MSSKARLVITAVVIEKRPVVQVARDYGVSRSWIYELLARYRAEGPEAFQARSRRPKTSPRATTPVTVELILALRKRLAEQGLDAGPETLVWHLRAQPHRPATIAELQALLERFVEIYNQQRPHRALPHRATPATAYTARPKAAPGHGPDPDTHDRVRTDKVDKSGTVTLRVAGRLRHIGIGRPHSGTHVLLIVQDHHVRVVDAATGELLRELEIDTTRDYQPRHPRTPT